MAPSLRWRPMAAADLPAVAGIAARVHPGLFEADSVFAERARLFPQGCLVLDAGGAACGYAVSHPWMAGRVPRLNTLLSTLPAHPDVLYIHDLALLPEARGRGGATAAVDRFSGLAAACGLPRLGLVAIGGTSAFWLRLGFAPLDDPDLQRSLGSYGPGAAYMLRAARGP